MTAPTILRIGIPASASHSRVAKPPAVDPLKVNLKALDKWIDQQNEPYTRPEAIRGMIETMLHIVSKDPGE